MDTETIHLMYNQFKEQEYDIVEPEGEAIEDYWMSGSADLEQANSLASYLSLGFSQVFGFGTQEEAETAEQGPSSEHESVQQLQQQIEPTDVQQATESNEFQQPAESIELPFSEWTEVQKAEVQQLAESTAVEQPPQRRRTQDSQPGTSTASTSQASKGQGGKGAGAFFDMIFSSLVALKVHAEKIITEIDQNITATLKPEQEPQRNLSNNMLNSVSAMRARLTKAESRAQVAVQEVAEAEVKLPEEEIKPGEEILARYASLVADLEATAKKCAELAEENERLREVAAESSGGSSEGDPLAETVRCQLESLLAEKARLAEENARLQRANQGLEELLMYTSTVTHEAEDSAHESEGGEDLYGGIYRVVEEQEHLPVGLNFSHNGCSGYLADEVQPACSVVKSS